MEQPQSTIKINELTTNTFGRLPRPLQNSLKFRSGNTTDLKTLDALKVRLFEYVHLRCMDHQATSLLTLNRKFHRPARLASCSVREAIDELVTEGLLEQFERKRTILVSCAYLRHQESLWDVLEYDHDRRTNILEKLLESAQ